MALTSTTAGRSAGSPRVQRLSSVPRPEEGEAFSSWFRTLQQEWGTSAGQTWTAIGVDSRELVPADIHAAQLSAPAIERIAAGTGLESDEVRAMLLSRYRHTALPNLPAIPDERPVDTWTTRRWAAGAWVLRESSNWCPPCLAERPSWPLAWKLPWAFVCLRHRVHLVGRCGQCGTAQNGRGTAPGPARCRNWVGRGHHRSADVAMARCSAPLAKAPTVEVTDEAVLETQREINQWLETATADGASLAVLIALALMAIRPAILDRVQPEVRDALVSVRRDREATELLSRRPPPWAEPMRMAAAAHLARHVRGAPPQSAVEWLRGEPREPLFTADLRIQRVTSHRVRIEEMAYGPWNHATAHLHAAFTAELLIPPFDSQPDWTHGLIPYYRLSDPEIAEAWILGRASA